MVSLAILMGHDRLPFRWCLKRGWDSLVIWVAWNPGISLWSKHTGFQEPLGYTPCSNTNVRSPNNVTYIIYYIIYTIYDRYMWSQGRSIIHLWILIGRSARWAVLSSFWSWVQPVTPATGYRGCSQLIGCKDFSRHEAFLNMSNVFL